MNDPYSVTAYTDASWHDGARTGAWGLWLRQQDWRVVNCGPLPAFVNGTAGAEMAAMYAAAHRAQQLVGGRLSLLYLRSDSTEAIKYIQRGAPPAKRPDMRQLQRLFWEVMGTADLNAKWVKGHAGTETTAGWLNDRVDKLVRKLGREQRDRTKGEFTGPSAIVPAGATEFYERKPVNRAPTYDPVRGF